jgi:hypothetical protein
MIRAPGSSMNVFCNTSNDSEAGLYQAHQAEHICRHLVRFSRKDPWTTWSWRRIRRFGVDLFYLDLNHMRYGLVFSTFLFFLPLGTLYRLECSAYCPASLQGKVLNVLPNKTTLEQIIENRQLRNESILLSRWDWTTNVNEVLSQFKFLTLTPKIWQHYENKKSVLSQGFVLS